MSKTASDEPSSITNHTGIKIKQRHQQDGMQIEGDNTQTHQELQMQ